MEPLDSQRLITIAIHTYDRAIELKHLLEHQGIQVALHNVNLSTPVVSSGVRVRIKEIDLPAALRVIENANVFDVSCNADSVSDKPAVLLPIDFNSYSTRVIDFAFNYASLVGVDILLLHTYLNPALSKRVQLTDNLSFELTESQETDARLYAEANDRIEQLTASIYEKIKQGVLPPVKFSSMIREGVPEDVIVDQSKTSETKVIIMGTRGAERKSQELIGSVTAEVLDTSRVPVMSIPETKSIVSPDDISTVVFLCNLDQDDILGVDAMIKLMPQHNIHVIFVRRPSRKEWRGSVTTDYTPQIDELVSYCRRHYPSHTFSSAMLPANPDEALFRTFMSDNNVSFTVLPNKKRNVFSRFFNPSVAHRIILNADAPLIVVPV